MKKIFFFLFLVFNTNLYSQIIVDNVAPYNSATYLIDNVLLGGGIVASNHSYQGEPSQIGWFDAINTNLDIDSGIVMCTGDIFALDPVLGSSFPILPNTVTDPDLLAVANSVPGLIGQSFSVTSINDVAILEFDFVPTSDSMEFRYAFGSQEYFAYENTQYNDVFGFFLSGPGIAGPWANGAINLAYVPNTNPQLPITISSVNSVTPINQQYFVDNQNGLNIIADADGFTTVFTAQALVECGETYHIKLAIADGSDQGLSSYVWLEAGSFYSPPLSITDGLGIDSTYMEIPCNATITLSADGGNGATYQWYDSTSTVFSTDSVVTVGAGYYVVEADIFGCAKLSDTLTVYADEAPTFELGIDYTIPCNTTTRLDPIVTGGLGVNFYQYIWSTGVNDTFIDVSEGTYFLEIDDGTGCTHRDTIVITEDAIPQATISGGGSICDNGNTTNINFNFNGLLPWDLIYTNGSTTFNVNDIDVSSYSVSTLVAGNYGIVLADDVNDCIADTINIGKVEVVVNPLPIAIIEPSDITIYLGDEIELTTDNYISYAWYTVNDILISNDATLIVQDSGTYKVFVEDENGCTDMSNLAIVRSVPLTQLFVPSVFTPNSDEHNELFVIQGNFIKTYNIRIFNKWGEQLFESNDMQKYWDGTFNNNKVQQGVYYYQIDILGEDGEFFTKTGNIQIIY